MEASEVVFASGVSAKTPKVQIYPKEFAHDRKKADTKKNLPTRTHNCQKRNSLTNLSM